MLNLICRRSRGHFSWLVWHLGKRRGKRSGFDSPAVRPLLEIDDDDDEEEEEEEDHRDDEDNEDEDEKNEDENEDEDEFEDDRG